MDDLTKRGPADRSRVNVHEDWELRYWARAFGVTPDQLKAAVRAVGVSAAAVRAYLQRR